MLIFRPAQFADLPAIEHLAVTAGGSMTTLPNNRDHLAQLISSTQQSLQKTVTAPGDQSYHFVVEDTDNQEILGISGIEACVGYSSPFYSFRCAQLEHHSAELQIKNTIDTLHLSQDYEGASRLYTFFLAGSKHANYPLSLLSLSRLMFIGQHPERFAKKLVLELQGIVDKNQRSPFWQALGQHFFNMDFHRANYLTGINAKGFIADLMPKYPVYVPLLNKSAQVVIGKLRHNLTAVKGLLNEQGFRQKGYISIFDGGPTLESDTATIKTIVEQFSVTVRIENTVTAVLNDVLISNNLVRDYACIHAQIDLDNIYLNPAQAQLLKVEEGDTIYVLALNSTPKTTTQSPLENQR